MPSNAKVKFIRSLRFKKYRKQNNCFIAEGPKIVNELINSELKILSIYANKSWIETLDPTNDIISIIEPVDAFGLKKISNLKTPNEVLAVVQIPDHIVRQEEIEQSLSLTLSEIRDPGNLGTIIRTADWFGIERIFLSESCADQYSNKVIQATMGSISRVKVINYSLKDLFSQFHDSPVIGGVMAGNNLYKQKLPKKGFILIGNESEGVNEDLLKFVTHPITIPSMGGAESLNAAVATGIICGYIAWSGNGTAYSR